MKKEFAKITNKDKETGLRQTRINLWSSTDGYNREVVGYCVNNEKVEILSRSDPYIEVRNKDGTEGWLLEDWLK